MRSVSLWSSIVGSVLLLSTVTVVAILYLHKRLKRASIWHASTDTQSVIHSAPTSRRASAKGLFDLGKASPLTRTRSASFGEDLPARLQILTPNTCYQSYSPVVIGPSTRANRSSLGANVRFPVLSNPPPTPSTSSSAPSISFQLRYEPTVETLLITIFQLHNYTPIKNTQTIFLILYLLPDEDQQRQTHPSADGTFNEDFHFLLQANDVRKRTLRVTAYTADSITRVRDTLGHVFLKLDQLIGTITNDKAFSTATISESLTPDLQIRPDHLGQLVLTSCHIKDQNLIQIRIQQLNHLHIDLTKIRFPVKAHFSGQTSPCHHKHHWTSTTSFLLSSPVSFRADQELTLRIEPSNETQIACHLRLHFNSPNRIHSHARWQQSLGSTSLKTLTVPLVAF